MNFLSMIQTESWSLIKISTKFLMWLQNGEIEKITVYLLFFLFIQFLAIEIRLVFSQTEFMRSGLQWLEKKVGVPVLVAEL